MATSISDDGVCLICQKDTLNNSRPIKTTEDILAFLDHFRTKKQEYLISLSLDGAQKVISRRVVTVGLLDVSLAHPREVFAGPLTDRAASIIIAHNHPSGMASPSKEDIKTTQQLVAAGILLGIPLQDHFIITSGNYYSFREQRMI